MPFRDDSSAPNVSARFGEQIRGDLEANNNVFDLNRGGVSTQQHPSGKDIVIGTTMGNHPAGAHG